MAHYGIYAVIKNLHDSTLVITRFRTLKPFERIVSQNDDKDVLIKTYPQAIKE